MEILIDYSNVHKKKEKQSIKKGGKDKNNKITLTNNKYLRVETFFKRFAQTSTLTQFAEVIGNSLTKVSVVENFNNTLLHWRHLRQQFQFCIFNSCCLHCISENVQVNILAYLTWILRPFYTKLNSDIYLVHVRFFLFKSSHLKNLMQHYLHLKIKRNEIKNK